MQAFVFDLDGTLLDTLADIGAACNAVLGRHGYPQHPLSAYSHMVGNGFAMLIRRALPQERMPDACALEAITDEAREWYACHLVERTRPYPHMDESLEQLAESGTQLAMLSNKPDNLCQILINHFFAEIPFAVIQGARAGVPLKPDPAPLESILKGMAIRPEDACYIGDSDVDIETAHNARIAGIGAAWGFRGAEELGLAGADLIIKKPADLVNLTIPTK